MTLDKLTADVIESGKEHPFVRLLLEELRRYRSQAMEMLMHRAGEGAAIEQIHALGGKALQADWTIKAIESARGTDR